MTPRILRRYGSCWSKSARRRARGIRAAARGKNVNPFARRHQRGHALRSKGKGAPFAHDQVDPRFERGGNGKVPHGRAQHHHVRGEQLVHQLIGECEGQFLRRGPLRGRREKRVDGGFIQVREAFERSVVVDDSAAGILPLPFFNEGRGKAA